MIYLLLLLPIFTALTLYIILRNAIAFRIGFVFTLIVLCYTLLHSNAMKDCLTDDTEWWGNYATSIHYYDDWDEEVSCRHPIYCTETYECGDGKNSRTCTREYVCGYQHAYDVDYHSEYWSIKWDNGTEQHINRNEYIYWATLWGNKFYNIELNRDFHENDGDDKACDWNLKPETSQSFVTKHTYENRTQASNTIFKADIVDSTDKAKYKLFDYPDAGEQIVFGAVKIEPTTGRLLKYINGYYGSRKQFKLFLCFYRNQSAITAERQHSYWDNLNKNEFLVCIGLDDSNQIQWCKSYSWMDKPLLSVKVEDYFRGNKSLHIGAFARWLPANIEQYWNRKHFKDFNYIQVEITQSQYTVLFVFCLFICIIQAIITYIQAQKK